MRTPPEILHGGRVVRWTAIDHRHRPTGYCRHFVAGEFQGPAGALAISQADDGVFYLCYCDSDWGAITDTYHRTLESALEQAEREYEGVSHTWNVV